MALSAILVELKAATSSFDKSIDQSTGKLAGLSKGGLSGIAGFAGLAAGGAALAWLDQGISKFADLGTQVAQFERVTGTSAQQASQWIAVGKNLGITTDDLTRSMGMLASNVQLHTDKLQKWGVEIVRGKDGAVDLTGTMDSLKARFQATTDATQRDAMAKDLLGKSYQTLLPYLTDTKTHIDEITAAAAKRGDILSQKDVTQAVDYKRSMEELKSSVDGFQRELGQALIPQLLSTVKELTGVLGAVDSLTKHFGGLNGVFKAANAVLNPLDFAYHGITKSLDGLTGSHHKAAATISGDFVGALGMAAISSMTMQQQTEATTAAQQALTDQMKTAATAEAAWSKQVGGDFDTIAASGGQDLARLVSSLHLTLPELDAVAQHTKDLQATMTSNFNQATDVVSAFGNQTKVTAADVDKFFTDQLKAAQNWSTNIQYLISQGVNQGIVDQLYNAGPKAAVALQGMVDDVSLHTAKAVNFASAAIQNVMQNTETAVATADVKFQTLGGDLIDGMTAGVYARQSGLINAITGVTNTALLRARQANGAHSPAQLWADKLGAPIGEGIAVGIQSRQPHVNAAVASLTGVPRLASPAGSGALGGGTTVVEINLDGKRIGQAVAAPVRSQMLRDRYNNPPSAVAF